MTERPRRRVRALAALALCCGLAACGADPSTRTGLAEEAAATRQPAELELGDVRIRASIAPSLALGEPIARRYGIRQDRNTHLLLVGVRRGPLTDESSVPARIRARVRDLRGVSRDIALHEVRSEGFIDYAGTVRVTPPDTLSFEIHVDELVHTNATLRFSRDVFP